MFSSFASLIAQRNNKINRGHSTHIYGMNDIIFRVLLEVAALPYSEKFKDINLSILGW